MTLPWVRAVLVTDGKSPHLEQTLRALAELDPAPSVTEIVMTADTQISIPAGLEVMVRHAHGLDYAQVLDLAVDATEARSEEYLWLLHDDTAPMPDALGRLLGAMARRKRAAIVGAALVRWNDPSRLVSLGTTVTRWGSRRIPLVMEGDLNQGQHDWRDDVLSASLAAALVRRAAWDRIGGLDRGYQGFGSSLEWSRRAWTLGWDVVIEPTARVRHAQDGLYGVRNETPGRSSTHLARRLGEWHHAFAWAAWWRLPLLAILVPLSAVSRALIRLAQNTPALAVQELVVMAALFGRLPAVMRSRSAHSRSSLAGKEAPRAIPQALFATTRQALQSIRHQELGGFDRHRALRVPSELERTELALQARAQRRGLFAVFAVSGLASLALNGRWLFALIEGQMLTAPGLGASDASASQVWTRAYDAWSEAGLGNATIDGAFATLLMPLTLLPGGLRVSIAALLIFAPLLAGVAAWFAAGYATRGPGVRAVAAIAYGVWPTLLLSVADARVAAVIAHAFLPLAAMAAAAALGVRRGVDSHGSRSGDVLRGSASAAAGASLLLGVVTVAQPGLLWPILLTLITVAVIAKAYRVRVAAMAFVPVVLSIPTLAAAIAQLPRFADAAAVLLREVGPGRQVEGGAWAQVLGLTFAERVDSSVLWGLGGAPWASMLVAAVLLSAALALLSRDSSTAATVGLVIVGLGALAAGAAVGTTAAFADSDGALQHAGWVGGGSSLIALGALLAALSAHGAVAQRRRVIAKVAGAAASFVTTAGSLVMVAVVALSGQLGAASMTDADVLPLSLPLEQEGPMQTRVLVLDAGDERGDVRATVLTGDGSTFVFGRSDLSSSGGSLNGEPVVPVSTLAPAVGALAVSVAADPQLLVEWGIGVVVVPPDDIEVQAVLDQNPAFSLISGSERGVAYRIASDEASRAWVETAQGRENVDSDALKGVLRRQDRAEGVLVIAVPASSGWKAWGDGGPLERVSDELGRAAFAVPQGTAVIEVGYSPGWLRWWWWSSVVVVLLVAVSAIPLRRLPEVNQ